MINFDEELKKFHPVTEITDLEEVVRQQDLTDMTDIMRELMRDGREPGRDGQDS